MYMCVHLLIQKNIRLGISHRYFGFIKSKSFLTSCKLRCWPDKQAMSHGVLPTGSSHVKCLYEKEVGGESLV